MTHTAEALSTDSGTTPPVDARVYSEDRRGRVTFMLWCLLVIAGVVGIKLVMAWNHPASSMFADDYDYLNKSPYYLRGDLKMETYPHSRVPAGYLYPVLVSPWMLTDDPHMRIFIVHSINIGLSAISILFFSLTVSKLARSHSPTIPLLLAIYPVIFLFSFNAMTENCVFAMLAVISWLVTDLGRTFDKLWSTVVLVAMVALLPLVRSPGLAVLPAVLLVMLFNIRAVGVRRTAILAITLTFMVGLFYVGYMKAAPKDEEKTSSREMAYLAKIKEVVESPQHIYFTLKLYWSQTVYLLMGTGFLAIPLFAARTTQICRIKDDLERRRWLNFATFAFTAAIIFVTFCLTHLIRKLDFKESESYFIFGRYDDPAAVLLFAGGLAALFSMKRVRFPQAFILRMVAPVALVFGIELIREQRWKTINQAGMAFWAHGGHSLEQAFGLMLILAALLLVRPPYRVRAGVVAVPLLLMLYYLDPLRPLIRLYEQEGALKQFLRHPGRLTTPEIAQWCMIGMWLVLAVVTSVAAFFPKRIRVNPIATMMLLLFATANYYGIDYMQGRVNGAAHSMQVAEWISRALPDDARIGYDGRMAPRRGPGAWKEMGDTYRGVTFGVYPRPTQYVTFPKKYDDNIFRKLVADIDYFFTLDEAEIIPELRVAWRKDGYVLYEVDRSATMSGTISN